MTTASLRRRLGALLRRLRGPLPPVTHPLDGPTAGPLIERFLARLLSSSPSRPPR